MVTIDVNISNSKLKELVKEAFQTSFEHEDAVKFLKVVLRECAEYECFDWTQVKKFVDKQYERQESVDELDPTYTIRDTKKMRIDR